MFTETIRAIHTAPFKSIRAAIALAFTGLMFFIEPNALAQQANDGPSAQETVEFINNILSKRIEQNIKYEEQIMKSDVFYVAKELDGNLVITDESIRTNNFIDFRRSPLFKKEHDGSKYHYKNLYTVPLGLVELGVRVFPAPDLPDVSSWGKRDSENVFVPSNNAKAAIRLNCRKSACIKRHWMFEGIKIYDDKQEGDGKNISSLTILVLDSEDAHRVARALDHLIKLNGGKGSLF